MVKQLKSLKTKFQDHHFVHYLGTSEPPSHHSQLLLHWTSPNAPGYDYESPLALSFSVPIHLIHFNTSSLSRPDQELPCYLSLAKLRCFVPERFKREQKGFRRIHESPKYSPNRHPSPTETRPTAQQLHLSTPPTDLRASLSLPTALPLLASYVRLS